MNKYIIQVTRITYSTQTVEVIAEDKHDALCQACNLSLDLDFSTDDVDYDYDIVSTKELDD